MDFIRWTHENYPADRYMLVLWDHGGGFSLGYGMDDLNKRKDHDTMLVNELSDALEHPEIPGLFLLTAPMNEAPEALDGEAFDSALEAFVNQTETWRRLLADYRPAAKAAAERSAAENPSFGSTGFMQV